MSYLKKDIAPAVIGILLLVWPSRTLEVVAILVGIDLLLVGAIQIGSAFGELSGSRAGPLLRGAFAAIAGIIVIRHPGGSLLVIALAVENTRQVKLSWVVGTTQASLIWIVFAAAALGWLLGIATSVVFRLRTRRR